MTVSARAHVVLRLGWELIERNHPSCANKMSLDGMKARYADLVAARYPTPAEQAALPEAERAGVVPPAVLEALRQHRAGRVVMAENKHATPSDAPRRVEEVFDHVRPLTCMPCGGISCQASVADERVHALSTNAVVQYRTSLGMVDQWNSQYPAMAWPLALCFQCGGPAYCRR